MRLLTATELHVRYGVDLVYAAALVSMAKSELFGVKLTQAQTIALISGKRRLRNVEKNKTIIGIIEEFSRCGVFGPIMITEKDRIEFHYETTLYPNLKLSQYILDWLYEQNQAFGKLNQNTIIRARTFDPEFTFHVRDVLDFMVVSGLENKTARKIDKDFRDEIGKGGINQARLSNLYKCIVNREEKLFPSNDGLYKLYIETGILPVRMETRLPKEPLVADPRIVGTWKPRQNILRYLKDNPTRKFTTSDGIVLSADIIINANESFKIISVFGQSMMKAVSDLGKAGIIAGNQMRKFGEILNSNRITENNIPDWKNGTACLIDGIPSYYAGYDGFMRTCDGNPIIEDKSRRRWMGDRILKTQTLPVQIFNVNICDQYIFFSDGAGKAFVYVSGAESPSEVKPGQIVEIYDGEIYQLARFQFVNIVGHFVGAVYEDFIFEKDSQPGAKVKQIVGKHFSTIYITGIEPDQYIVPNAGTGRKYKVERVFKPVKGDLVELWNTEQWILCRLVSEYSKNFYGIRYEGFDKSETPLENGILEPIIGNEVRLPVPLIVKKSEAMKTLASFYGKDQCLLQIVE